MGSFNVSCSMSSISIGCGTKVAFIPLLPSEMGITIGRKYNKYNLSPGVVFLPPSANWVSNEGAFQFYKPFSLPIFGEYNDYGGIENVEDNITAKVIKEYFGITIEEFVDCIGNSRGDYDYFSPIFGSYFEKDKKLLSDYSTHFNEEWLIKMGFTKLENGFFQFKLQPFLVSIFEVKEDEKKHRQAGFGYQIMSSSNNKILDKNADTYDNREKFLESYLRLSGYHLGYKEEAQEKIKLLSQMSGMFIHYDIYDFMAHNSFSEYSSNTNAGSWLHDADLNEDSLKKLGFKFRCSDKTIERFSKIYEYPGITEYVIHCDGTWSQLSKTSEKYPNGDPKQKHYVEYGIYHPSSLIQAWKDLTGIELKVDEVKAKESKFGAIFDQIREQYLEYISQSESEEEKEFEKKRIERLNLLKSNPDELKKAIEELKANEDRLSLLMSLSRFSNDDFDEEDDFDDESEENETAEKVYSDEEIGRAIISLQEERIMSRRGLYDNPLQNPKGHLYLPLKPSYDKYNMLSTLYEACVKDGSIRKDVMDFCNFYWSTYAMNKVFMPASNGYQFGCHGATYHLAKKTMELMDQEMKRYEEEEEEEEV
jgi:hypothetical protein